MFKIIIFIIVIAFLAVWYKVNVIDPVNDEMDKK
jgi:hypothetical protein